MNKDMEPLRIDEMGIEVCVLCDCAVENNTCLCDMRGWQYGYDKSRVDGKMIRRRRVN